MEIESVEKYVSRIMANFQIEFPEVKFKSIKFELDAFKYGVVEMKFEIDNDTD